MNWDKGFSASYVMMQVNPQTWEDEGEIPITGGKIDRDIESALIESASVETTAELGERWIRLYLVAKQGESAERVPLFTGLTSSPTRALEGYNPSYSVDCFSVLTPCADRMLPRGWFAPKDGNGASIIADLLGISGAEVETFEGGGTLTGAIVAESGETYLSMSHKVADAIGWQIRIDGPEVSLAVRPMNGFVDIAGTAVVSGNSKVPIAEHIIQRFKEQTSRLGRANRIHALIDQRIHLQSV